VSWIHVYSPKNTLSAAAYVIKFHTQLQPKHKPTANPGRTAVSRTFLSTVEQAKMSVATKHNHIASAVAESTDVRASLRQLGARIEQQLHEFKRFLAAWSVTAPGVQMPNVDVGALAQDRSLRK
jgi:hypothetical protein